MPDTSDYSQVQGFRSIRALKQPPHGHPAMSRCVMVVMQASQAANMQCIQRTEKQDYVAERDSTGGYPELLFGLRQRRQGSAVGLCGEMPSVSDVKGYSPHTMLYNFGQVYGLSGCQP